MAIAKIKKTDKLAARENTLEGGVTQITGEYCLERGRESGKPLAPKHRGASTMGGERERKERRKRQRNRLGHLKKLKTATAIGVHTAATGSNPYICLFTGILAEL